MNLGFLAITFLVLIAALIGAFPIRKNDRLELSNHHSAIKRKLPPSYKYAPSARASTEKTNAFKELETLRKIPIIIDKLKNHKLNVSELRALGKTFGDLWPLIIEEANRSPKRSMNPILRTLLSAYEKPLIKNDVEPTHFNYNIKHNSANYFKHKDTLSPISQIPKQLRKLRMKTNLPPAQRLMKVAALLIRESLLKNSQKPSQNKPKCGQKTARRTNKILKKQLKSDGQTALKTISEEDKNIDEVLNLPFRKAEKTVTTPKASTMRNKRSANFLNSDDEDEVKINALQSLIEQNEHEKEQDEDYNDDYGDYSKRPGAASGTQREEQQQLRREQQEKQLSFINSDDYKDYAFDTTDTDQFNEEEDLLRNFYGHQARRAVYDDYDSFSDLMRLAAANNRRNSNYLKRLHFQDYLNDDGNSFDNNSMDYVS